MRQDEKLFDQLRASEERYRTLVEQLPAGVYMSTLERIGQFVYLSPHAERILGKTLEEFDAKPSLYLDLIHPEDRDVVEEKSREATRALRNYSLEYRIVRGEETVIWLRDKGHIIYDRYGSPEVVQGILFDITLEKQEEAEYRTLVRAVEQSPNVIVVTDSEAHIEYVNPAFEEVTGYRADEALGQNPRILKSGVHEAEYYRDMWETLSQDMVWRGEICNKKKDGSIYWEDISISPVTGMGKKTTHYIAVKRDITERKELERMREEVDRISRHDLKTPLGGIIGLPQLLIEDGNLTERQVEYAKLIEESGRKMLNLLNRSVDLFKMEQGTYEYQRDRVDVAHVIQQLIGDNEKLLRKKKILIECDYPSEGETAIYAEGEELLAYTMFGNLLANALEASPLGAAVQISFRIDEMVRVSLCNEGEVPKEVEGQFFEKYVTCGKRNGTGMGTYSAKMSAEIQGGSIEMESGGGKTSVTVSLRRSAET